MITIADLKRHFLKLCADEEADVQWCDSASKALALSGEVEFIRAPRIKSETAYAVAMHELGHIKSNNEFSNQIERGVRRGTGPAATPLCGRLAWKATPLLRCSGMKPNAAL